MTKTQKRNARKRRAHIRGSGANESCITISYRSTFTRRRRGSSLCEPRFCGRAECKGLLARASCTSFDALVELRYASWSVMTTSHESVSAFASKIKEVLAYVMDEDFTSGPSVAAHITACITRGRLERSQQWHAETTVEAEAVVADVIAAIYTQDPSLSLATSSNSTSL